jgi:hypothetical protein
MTNPISRRHFISLTAAVPLAGAAAGLSFWQSQAWADGLRELTSEDPRYGALGYVADAAKATTDPMFKAGSNCLNCSQLKGDAGAKLRPCALFPDLQNPKQMLLVNVNGWCRSWMAIPKA